MEVITGAVPVLNSDGEVVSFRRVSEKKDPTVPNTYDGLTFDMQNREGSLGFLFNKNGPLHPGRRGRGKERG